MSGRDDRRGGDDGKGVTIGRRLTVAGLVLTAGPALAQSDHQGHTTAPPAASSHDWHGPMPDGSVPGTPDRRAARGYREVVEQMRREIDAALTGDPDRDLIPALLAHQRGAIDMARLALDQARSPEIRAFAQQILQERETELLRWQAMPMGRAGP
ncbi:DUF305 domain-containing protein [Muricoccus radiodurans]|uniref:DUF305 domain-containing protein n=1 Tax=Muricoccus radiodurans TaxID=2231721 RepID=UPI003CEDA8A7